MAHSLSTDDVFISWAKMGDKFLANLMIRKDGSRMSYTFDNKDDLNHFLKKYKPLNATKQGMKAMSQKQPSHKATIELLKKLKRARSEERIEQLESEVYSHVYPMLDQLGIESVQTFLYDPEGESAREKFMKKYNVPASMFNFSVNKAMSMGMNMAVYRMWTNPAIDMMFAATRKMDKEKVAAIAAKAREISAQSNRDRVSVDDVSLALQLLSNQARGVNWSEFANYWVVYNGDVHGNTWIVGREPQPERGSSAIVEGPFKSREKLVQRLVQKKIPPQNRRFELEWSEYPMIVNRAKLTEWVFIRHEKKENVQNKITIHAKTKALALQKLHEHRGHPNIDEWRLVQKNIPGKPPIKIYYKNASNDKVE